jgi:hypothetical protein
MAVLLLVIVDNLDCLRAAVSPAEADTPLIVDPDAVLPGAIPLESLEPVPRRDSEVTHARGDLELAELSACHLLNARKPPDPNSRMQRLRVAALEGSDHPLIVTRRVSIDNRERRSP